MELIGLLFALLLLLVFGFRFFYAVVRVFTKRKHFPPAKPGNRYAVMIAARNEDQVIGPLLDSLRKQDYPSELIDLYVVADNCTDRTAEEARAHGATVYERHNLEQASKGYALQYLFNKVLPLGISYDGFFVFDADNLLDPGYISAMHAAFVQNKTIIIGYRTAKNFGDSWVTAAYGLYFLHESEFLNASRDKLGTTCFLSGTGCLFPAAFLKDGWHWTGLTEDLECTLEVITTGNHICYCGDAVLYDEQPRRFGESIPQRSRWVRGYTAAITKNMGKLFRSLFRPRGFGAFDFIMNLGPLIGCVGGVIFEIVKIVTFASQGMAPGMIILQETLGFLSVYGGMLLIGAVTLFAEWTRIVCPARKKLLYTLFFPLFMISYLFVYILAVLQKPQWKAIKHDVSISIDDLKK